MLHPISLLIVFLYLGQSATAFGFQSQAIAEWAPLKGFGGETSFSVEKYFNSHIGLQGFYDTASWESERRDFTNTGEKYGLSLIGRPLLSAFPGLFLGSGFVYETATIGRQQRRDGTTWIRTNADEIYDLWTNEDRYLAFSQQVGYRWVFADWLTTSVRILVDEIVWWDSTNKEESLYSRELDLASRGREPVQKAVMFHAGVALP